MKALNKKCRLGGHSWLMLAAMGVLMTCLTSGAYSAPGDIVAHVNVPVVSSSGVGIGIAVDCGDPVTLYYTNSYDPNLYRMDKDGNSSGSPIPLTDANTGDPISFGAISWDRGREKIWAGSDSITEPNDPNDPNTYRVKVYLVDPATGVATYIFTVVTSWIGFTDGIAFDGSDNSVWISDDISNWVEHWDVSAVDANGSGAPTYIGTIYPTDANGDNIDAISGVAVGKGDILYLGRNGLGKITRIHKDGTFESEFATVGGRDEDLECDVISFAPLEVLWSKDAYDDSLYAIEVESGTCECGGGTMQVDLDIKPTSCPNPLNLNSRGVLPVAILGSEDLDVTTIDVASIQLEGVAPIRSSYEDVATPVADGQDCECTEEGPDGFLDLTLKFKKTEVIAALGEVQDGNLVPLTLTGMLREEFGGTPIEGSDCVRIKGEVPDGILAAKADINKDGVVNLADLAILKQHFWKSTIAD